MKQPTPARDADTFEKAKCLSASVESKMWWASPGTEETEYAKALCRRCPARRACGEFGKSQPAGIWAGFDVTEELDHLKHWLDPAVTPPETTELCKQCAQKFTPGRTAKKRATVCPKCRSGLVDATATWPIIDALYTRMSGPEIAARTGISRQTVHCLTRRDAERQKWAQPKTIAALTALAREQELVTK